MSDRIVTERDDDAVEASGVFLQATPQPMTDKPRGRKTKRDLKAFWRVHDETTPSSVQQRRQP